MGVFAPFSFLEKNPALAPSWTPADFTNVQYWWTADAGVTESGGAVSSWTDQINSYSLAQGTGANQPTLTTSANMNGENIISFNGTSDFLYASTAPASHSGSDMTMLMAFYIGSSTPGNGIVFGFSYVGNSTGRGWLDGLNGNLRNWDSWPTTGGTGRVIQAAAAGKYAFKYRYDESAGDTFRALNTLTETTGYTGQSTGQDYASDGVFVAGATLNSRSNPTVFLSRYIAMELAQCVVIHGTPSGTEMNEWKGYINAKYGTIIS